MARSTYLYVLYKNEKTEVPEAVFTVKHEAVTYWINNMNGEEDVIMRRVGDGHSFSDMILVKKWQ